MVVNQDWGVINFKDAQPELKHAFDLINDLLRLPVGLLSEDRINRIISSLIQLSEYINEVKNFNTLEGNAGERRNGISQNLKAQINTFYEEAQGWIPYLAYRHEDVQKHIDELSGAVGQVQEILTSAKQETEAKKTEIDDIVVAAKEASAVAGVAHFSRDFLTEAEKLEKSAQRWLWATGVFIIITLLAGSYFLYFLDEPPSMYSAIYLSTTKLIILGTLITATVWCGKIYRALRHQVTTNRHRANAIKTFQAFNKAASDEAARDAVLMETTRAIFGSSPSGYLDQETAGSGNEQTRIIELPGRTHQDSFAGSQ